MCVTWLTTCKPVLGTFGWHVLQAFVLHHRDVHHEVHGNMAIVLMWVYHEPFASAGCLLLSKTGSWAVLTVCSICIMRCGWRTKELTYGLLYLQVPWCLWARHSVWQWHSCGVQYLILPNWLNQYSHRYASVRSSEMKLHIAWGQRILIMPVQNIKIISNAHITSMYQSHLQTSSGWQYVSQHTLYCR